MPPVLWPVVVALGVFGLHLVLPARQVEGYVTGPQGRPLRYRLNGPLVMAVVVAGWAFACHRGLLAWNALFVHRWSLLVGACLMGVAFTAWVVLREPPVPGWSLAKQLFLGCAEQPQWLGARVDAKMWLYLVGAVGLELNLLSFAAHHRQLYPEAPSAGVTLHVGLFTFFLVEYLCFERVHLYTYDFVAERVGFKLGWGCLVFYPFFYAVGLWGTAEAPSAQWPSWALAGCAALFFAGWALSRGANLQKYAFKRDPTRVALGVLVPEALEGEGGRKVLVSGFWGLSRHINYLGEVLMALGLALSLGHPASPWPWLYPLYYVALLVTRQLDDDRRCAAKYGPLWAAYVKRVPWRIIPIVY